MAATHNNYFLATFRANITEAQVRDWLERHPPPYKLDDIQSYTTTEYDQPWHVVEVCFWVPDDELDVVAEAVIEGWCEDRMGVGCGFDVEMA